LLALAGAGSLINQRLNRELTVLTKEARIGDSAAAMRSVQDTQEISSIGASTEEGIVAPSGRFVKASKNTPLQGEPVTVSRSVPLWASFWDKVQAAQAVAKLPLFDLETARRVYELTAQQYDFVAPQTIKGEKSDFWNRAREAHAMAEFVAKTGEASAAIQAELAMSAIRGQLINQTSQMLTAEGAEAQSRAASRESVGEGLSKQYPIEPGFGKAIPTSSPSSTRPIPEIQDFDVKESDEPAEEDLRDLERKISRILSEQLSRYYGSSRM
jgi:hypothetical protein